MPDGDRRRCLGAAEFRTELFGGQRWQRGAGQLDRVWILDVDGRRLAVEATHMPGAAEEQIAALTE